MGGGGRGLYTCYKFRYCFRTLAIILDSDICLPPRSRAFAFFLILLQHKMRTVKD